MTARLNLDLQAAQSTNAWIITSGFNMGVMRAVGEAVSRGQTYSWDNMELNHTLRCIGIGPWGYVERRSTLERKDGKVIVISVNNCCCSYSLMLWAVTFSLPQDEITKYNRG